MRRQNSGAMDARGRIRKIAADTAAIFESRSSFEEAIVLYRYAEDYDSMIRVFSSQFDLSRFFSLSDEVQLQ